MRQALALLAVLLTQVSFAPANAADQSVTLTRQEEFFVTQLVQMAPAFAENGIDKFSYRIARYNFIDDSPMRMFYGQQQGCILSLNLRNSPLTSYVLRTVGREIDQGVKVRTVLAHELGHCAQVMDAARHGYSLSADSSNIERFADFFALAWTTKYHPEDFNDALQYLTELRDSDLSKSSEIYATPDDFEAVEGSFYRAWNKDLVPFVSALMNEVTRKQQLALGR